MSDEKFTLRAAVYLILTKDGKTLLSRRFNTNWMDGKYSLIAGHLDGNEKVSDAMIREAMEEAGIKVEKEDLKPVKVLHRNSKEREYMDFFFIAEKMPSVPTHLCPYCLFFAHSLYPSSRYFLTSILLLRDPPPGLITAFFLILIADSML